MQTFNRYMQLPTPLTKSYLYMYVGVISGYAHISKNAN